MAQKIKITWTESAINDLNRIYQFLAENSEKAASNIIDKIFIKTELLKSGYLKAGQEELLLANKPDEYRYLIQGNYKIIYRILPAEVLITTVFDTRQNPDKLPSKV